MDTVLGLLGLLAYIAVILVISSGVTWLVVKLSPSKSQKQLEARKDAASG